MRKNINRGYQKLIVWQDAKELYGLTCGIFRGFPYELKRVASQQIASVDSVHRNIAEGYCRRGINEYLQALNIAMGSLGESVSGFHVYAGAGQISGVQFEAADALSFKLENGLKRLIESLQQKRNQGEWDDSFVVRESNAIYEAQGAREASATHHSIIPPFHHSRRTPHATQTEYP
ncbi:MAG: four helix bundle protein [Kiritimatiellae bacterium]|nr:four helix bundle protein [Kiritimatiellia bacterium]